MSRELPLRRSKTLTALRATQGDQTTRLQIKNQLELDLLDEIRNFAKQRSNIEKEYAQSMLRLTSQFLQKREVNSLSPAEEHNGNRSVSEVWRSFLEETDAMCKTKMSIAERLATEVAEPVKSERQNKSQQFKKCHDLSSRMHAELQQSLRDVSKAKKTYRELESIASAARKNYSEAQDRRNRKTMRFYQSKSQLEKKFAQAESKLQLCEKRSVVARNEYILSLSALNAHQERYYVTDIPSLMQTMDADLFGKLREWFSLMADMEVKASCSSLESYQRLHSQAGMISREFELKSFLRANLQLVEFNRFAFEPHKDDTVNQLVQEYEADVILNKEARKCATKITKEIRTIREKTKALRGLQTVSTAYTTTPEFGSADAQVDVDQQIDDIQNAIRKAEIQKLKAEARLVVLRDAGVDVDQWKKSAGVSDSRENLLNVGDSNMSGSLLSLETTSEAPNGSVDFESSPEGSFGENQFTGLDDDDDDQSSNRHFDMPRKGIVLYDYEATKEDELSIHEGEEVSVLWYDGFGWCKGCNSLGIEGFFPESYVEVSEESPPQDLTFQSQNDADTTLTDERVQDNIRVLRALYSYRASGNDELSFPEGAIIKLLRKDDNGVDDGFWEGEYEGRVGVFPSILVEQVDSVSSLDSGSAFSPPGDYVLPPMSDLVSGSPILQSPLSARESHESSSFDWRSKAPPTPQISVSRPAEGSFSGSRRPLSYQGRAKSLPQSSFHSQTPSRRGTVSHQSSTQSASVMHSMPDWSKFSDDLESYV